MTMTIIKMEDHAAAMQAEYDEQSHSGSEDGDYSSEAPADEEHRCKYPSKFCGRARAQKTNGTYHRFCQYHRLKANTNQKRWTSVRRQQAAMEEQQRRRAETFGVVGSVPMAYPMHYTMYHNEAYAPHWTPGLLPDPVNIDPSAEPVDLAAEDVQILNALFVSDMGYDQRGMMQPREMNYCQDAHKPAFPYSHISL